ncbi:MAG TPA: hypothetical protein DCM27_01510 [Rhodospirillaceae bacterium]|nr:hypothetical protein [Rhodospirillaceae bacterium]
MEHTFNNAVNGGDNNKQLIITCDWQRTLSDLGFSNYPLLEDLSDAKRADHQVIIASAVSHICHLESAFECLVMMARRAGYDVLDPHDFTQITKRDLAQLGWTVDYAFDDQPIADQGNYVDAAVEIRIHSDYSRTPYSREQFRQMIGLPSRENPAPSPAPKI